MKKWLAEIKEDFFKKEFFPLKVLYFFMIGGMTTLFPFLTIQARSLGITEEELGIIYSLLPVIGIFGPSLSGLLADKIGNFKILLSASVACSGLAALLFILIPPGRIDLPLPPQLPINLNCTEEAQIKVQNPFQCKWREQASNQELNLRQCRYICAKEWTGNEKNDLENWCNNLQSCFIVGDVKIAGENGSISKNAYDIGEQNKQFVFNVTEVNLQMSHSKASNGETKFTLEERFCPSITNKRDDCWLECVADADSKEACSNKEYTKVLDPYLTILTYIVVRLVNGMTLATSFTLFEGAVVAIIKEHKGDLGLQRLYGNFGMIFMTPISGKLIDLFSQWNHKEDYTPAFVMYCVIKFICAFLFLFINLEFKQPSNSVIKDFKGLIVQPKVLSFILFVLVAGTSFGFIETFLFWVLEDLGADKSLMGITVTVGAIFGIPLLMSSSILIQKMGHINLLSICMIFYTIRMFGYSLITNPWWAMPFEAMEGITNSLMTVVCISYAGVLSTASTVASLQGLYGGTYHGAGRGIGSLIGGIMIKNIGNSGTFQILAGSCAIGGIAYYVVSRFILKVMDEPTKDGNQELKNDATNVKNYTNENKDIEK